MSLQRGEAFPQRVQNLKDAWAERRQMSGMSRVHDLDSQFSLMLTLHSWAADSVRQIEQVYGSALAASVSAPPSRGSPGGSFSALVGNHSLTFTLHHRQRNGDTRWSVAVTLSSPGGETGTCAAGPERRNGHWTRARLEDLLLTVLGAWERSQSDGDQLPPGDGMHRPHHA